MNPFSRWLLVLATTGSASCMPDVSRRIAVGAHTTLPTNNGPCDISRADGSGIVKEISGGGFEAVAPGTLRIECRDGSVVADVRVATRLEIVGLPIANAGVPQRYDVRALDWGGEDLDIGDFAPVKWETSGVFGPTMACDRATCTTVLASEKGKGEVIVKFGPLKQSLTVNVR